MTEEISVTTYVPPSEKGDTVSKSVSQLSCKKGPAKFGQSWQVCNFGCPNLKLQLMLLTKEQISEQMCKHAQKKNGLHDLMEIMIADNIMEGKNISALIPCRL